MIFISKQDVHNSYCDYWYACKLAFVPTLVINTRLAVNKVKQNLQRHPRVFLLKAWSSNTGYRHLQA